MGASPREMPPLPPASPSPGHLDLLISLLSDESPTVQGAVRSRIQRLGKEALPGLMRGSRSQDPVLRARCRELVQERGRERAARRLVRYALHARHDLDTALLLLDDFVDPGRDPRPTLRAIHAMGQEVARRLRRRGQTPAQVLSEYLYKERGFTGMESVEPAPGHASLARAVETRTAMPLVLCALWRRVAATAGLRCELLPVPGHVVLLVRQPDGDQLVDPFGDGELIEREHVLGYLSAHNLPFQEEWLKPAPTTSMFLRHTLNTAACFRAIRRRGEVRRLARVVRLLAGHPEVPTQPLG